MSEPRTLDLSAQHESSPGKHWIPAYKIREIQHAIFDTRVKRVLPWHVEPRLWIKRYLTRFAIMLP